MGTVRTPSTQALDFERQAAESALLECARTLPKQPTTTAQHEVLRLAHEYAAAHDGCEPRRAEDLEYPHRLARAYVDLTRGR